jgi:hypothetical protein
VGREEQFSMSVETILFLGDKIWFPRPRFDFLLLASYTSAMHFTKQNTLARIVFAAMEISYPACKACRGNTSLYFSEQIGSNHDIHTIQCDDSKCRTLAYQCVSCVSQPTWSSKRSVIRHATDRRAQQAEELQANEGLQAVDMSFEAATGDDNDDDCDQYYDDNSGMLMDDHQQEAHNDNNDEEDLGGDEDGATSLQQQAWIQELRDNPQVGEDNGFFTLDRLERNSGFDCDSASPGYYHFKQTNPGASGSQYVVGKAFKKDPCDVSSGEAKFHLILTRLLSGLTAAKRKDLAFCLGCAVNYRGTFEGDASTVALDIMQSRDVFQATRVPVCEKDFNDFYLRKGTAVRNQLPHPVVKSSECGKHAYVTLTDVIANLLASGQEVEKFSFEANIVITDEMFDGPTKPTVSTTRAACELYFELRGNETEGFVLYIWIKKWRDDFDPFNTKASRNQAWISTNTLCPTSSESKGRNTYFMAIGSKGDDHEVIERLFAEEMEALSAQGTVFYWGAINKFIRVKAGVISTCVDRPERATMYQIGDHNGTFSMCWGNATLVDSTYSMNHLPSCHSCRKLNLEQHRDAAAGVPLDNVDSPLIPGVEPVSRCPRRVCARWDPMSPLHEFNIPTDFPLRYDDRPGAPVAPEGRAISSDPNRKLRTIYLTVAWLATAVFFAYHQATTPFPGGKKNEKYWNKSMLVSYLRTCGATNKLIDAVYKSAVGREPSEAYQPPQPSTWSPGMALQRCHYAAMHMLFLGHVNSNYDMIGKWLARHELKGTFGKQANMYLAFLQRQLRCSRYYNAQPLSTSSWGTGIWVSENYLFWGRVIKFFFTLPAIHESSKAKKDSDDGVFASEVRMILRFVCTTNACLSRLMSNDRKIDDMDRMIKIYMDTMVELDQHLTNQPAAADADDDADTGTSGRRKRPNFTKGNSLGLLAAAEAHRYFGPAALHWEGGWPGERKIQSVKPEMGIKRNNAAWEKIVLKRLYQNEAIEKLLEEHEADVESTHRDRSMEGVLHVYQNVQMLATAAFDKHEPLSAVELVDGSLWIASRPDKKSFEGSDDVADVAEDDGEEAEYYDPEVWTRSAVTLHQIFMNDHQGRIDKSGICWFAPVLQTGYERKFNSMLEIKPEVRRYVLLLPLPEQIGTTRRPNWIFTNMYFAVGHDWTERVKTEGFVRPDLPIHDEGVFQDWLLESTNTE